MAYSVTDTDAAAVMATGGSITGQQQRRNRLLDTTVRVGTPKFDNYRRINGQIPRFTVTTPVALEDNEGAIRQSAWLATDRVYRNASQRLIQIKADEKLRAAASDDSDDFSQEEPQVFYGTTPPLKFNTAEWE